MSIGADPVFAIAALALAGLGGILFVRALIADRRHREAERSTIRRRSAAGGPATLRYAGPATSPDDAITLALRTFLTDPDRLDYVDIEGPKFFRLRFALLQTDPRVLRAAAINFSRLDPRDHPGPDAEHGLVTLGWAAPTPLAGHDFVAEWSLPVDLNELGAFVLSTARIYDVDTSQLRPRFGNPPALGAPPPSTSPEAPVDVRPVADSPIRNVVEVVRGWLRHPVVRWSTSAIAVVVLLAGPERLEAFMRSIPVGLVYGTFGLALLRTGVPYLVRYLRTSDPFRLTGWNRLRGRVVTTYQRHIWWGVFGAIFVIGGVALLIVAVSELT